VRVRIRAMTPELEKEVIIGVVSVTLTALFTGIQAAALVWWTWQRDQERLVVQKLLVQGQINSGESVTDHDELGTAFGILVRNRSLFAVHITAMGFKIDGKVIVLGHPVLPTKMMRNPDPLSNRPFILDENFDPNEVPSQTSWRVEVIGHDRLEVIKALLKASERLNLSIEELVRGPHVEALVALETGKEFTSKSFWTGVKQGLEKALRPPEEMRLF
jgi:hypothetical protein